MGLGEWYEQHGDVMGALEVLTFSPCRAMVGLPDRCFHQVYLGFSGLNELKPPPAFFCVAQSICRCEIALSFAVRVSCSD